MNLEIILFSTFLVVMFLMIVFLPWVYKYQKEKKINQITNIMTVNRIPFYMNKVYKYFFNCEFDKFEEGLNSITASYEFYSNTKRELGYDVYHYNTNYHDECLKLLWLIAEGSNMDDRIINFDRLRPSQRANTVFFYALEALVKGNTKRFIKLFKEYKGNLKNRYESIILNEEMNEYYLFHKKHTFRTDFTELFYRFYDKNTYIEKEIEEFKPSNELESVLFNKILKHYYSHTEQHALIETLNEEY